MIYYFVEKKNQKTDRSELMLFADMQEALKDKEHLEDMTGDRYTVKSLVIDENTVYEVK